MLKKYFTNKEFEYANKIIHQNEAKPHQIYKISHAEPDVAEKIKTGKKATWSGHSFGRFQTDLGQNPEKKDSLMQLLKNSKIFIKEELKKIDQNIFLKRNAEIYNNNGLKNKINSVLQTKEGKTLIDKWDKQQKTKLKNQFNEIMEAVQNNPRYKNDQKFKTFVDSFEFKVYVIDSSNQHGHGNLKKFVSGKNIQSKKGKDKLFDKGELNFDRLKKFGDKIYAKPHWSRKQKTINQAKRILDPSFMEDVFCKSKRHSR